MSAKSAIKVIVPDGADGDAVQVGRAPDGFQERAQRTWASSLAARCLRRSASSALWWEWPARWSWFSLPPQLSLSGDLGRSKKQYQIHVDPFKKF